MEQRVNYDKIAHLYDEPSRNHILDAYLLKHVEHHPEIERSDMRILDIGCGIGKQLHVNREQFPGATMIGLDLYSGMLREAQNRNESICWLQGDGAYLPLKDGSIHYAINQFSYPHIQEKERLFHEAYRVLKSKGKFVVTNIDPWKMANWILYRFFPEAKKMDHRDFLPVPEIEILMRRAGFQNVTAERDRRQTHENLRDFLDFAAHRHRASHFVALSDELYRQGLKRIKEELSKHEDDDPYLDSEVCLVTISGEK